MAVFGAVVGLARFPVKSMQGERCERLGFDGRGAVGDRAWALRYADGKLGSGKNHRRFRKSPHLIECTATYEGPDAPVSITLPSGERVHPGDPRLAELLGPDAALAREPQPPAGTELKEVWHQDQGAVSLVSTGSLCALGELLGDGPDAPADLRRFRKNIVIENDEPWSEEALAGHEILLGGPDGVRLRVTERVPRCVMTTLPQPGLPADNRILKTLTAERDMCFGMYADVVAPGTVALGDAVTVAGN
ncbi:MOSC domain-containing protein [Streptomyces sp. NPDC002851]